MIPHVVYVLRTNEKGWRTRIRHQTPILSCSGVAIPFVKLLVWSFHKWYRYTTARQYRSLMTNSGTPSFLVGTQDIDHMRYHNVSFMSQSCLPSFLYNPYIPFLICRNFFFTSNYYIESLYTDSMT